MGKLCLTFCITSFPPYIYESKHIHHLRTGLTGISFSSVCKVVKLFAFDNIVTPVFAHFYWPLLSDMLVLSRAPLWGLVTDLVPGGLDR